MPTIGEIKKGKEIGKKSHINETYQWLACPNCGKARWVRHDQDKNSWCRHCVMVRMVRKRVRIPSGGNHYNWKGGRHEKFGYIYIKVNKESPFISMANRFGYIPEHRLVMAQHLGRPLESDEIVHHKNQIRNDNRLENLELLTLSEHNKLHSEEIKEILTEVKILRLQVKNLQEQIRELSNRQLPLWWFGDRTVLHRKNE